MSLDTVVQMTQLTPTERLEALLKQENIQDAHRSIEALLSHYESFLKSTNVPEKELIEKFQDKAASRTYMANANKFGEVMFEALTLIGNKSRLHRLLVV